MTHEELKAIRRSLGLSAEQFAQAVGAGSGRTVRRWEADEREIPGPLARLLQALDEVRGMRAWLLRQGSNGTG